MKHMLLQKDYNKYLHAIYTDKSTGDVKANTETKQQGMAEFFGGITIQF